MSARDFRIRPFSLRPHRLPGLLLALAAIVGCGETRVELGPIAMRRITAEQYRQTIADVFDPAIEVTGRFEPDSRHAGLLAVGTAFVSITPAGFEQYDAIARRIAEQVLAPDQQARFVPCRPIDPAKPDAKCAGAFLRKYGLRLLRRPLTDDEIAERSRLAAEATERAGDFHAGLRVALASLLVAPEFLFRVERASGDPENPDRLRLTDYSLASRLSHFLWNTTPDPELLAAAERGELASDAGLAREVDRLLASPRLEAGVRAYFADLLGFDALEDVSKDAIVYPRFSRKLLEDAREQTLRVVADHLVTQRADYRDLFTTRKSVMTRALGLVYGVPVRAREGFEAMEFASDSPRAGIQSHVSVLALHAHPGRSSATLRGIFVREALLCQEVPAAPADVDFTVVQDVANPDLKTARERLEAHRTDAACANCHRLVDPVGLALEPFDGSGMGRETENGAPIDASGELDGEKFVGPVGLGETLHDSDAAAACAVLGLFRYALGREPELGEKAFVRALERRFEEVQYRFPDLMREIVLSEPFRTTSGPRALEAEKVVPRTEAASARSAASEEAT
jgi:Protein of unknown function (DUF1592)/Protein of unknown function (DUF1588)/Protein of unknown function (DUF1585)/Protein of unknown function (DUF1595)/Protein of unknown function (DUF1587)